MNFEHIKIPSNLSSGNFFDTENRLFKGLLGGYIKGVVTYCLHILLLRHLEEVGQKRSFCQLRQRYKRKKCLVVDL